MTDATEDKLRIGAPVLSLADFTIAREGLGEEDGINITLWVQYRQAVALEGLLRLLARIEHTGGFRRG